MIPSWLSSDVNESDLKAVEQAVAQAESQTAGEIVPMIVRQSTPAGHVPIVATLLFFVFFLLILPLVIWQVPGPAWAYDVGIAVLSCLLGWSVSKLPATRRLLIPLKDQAQSVFHRAQLEFHETGIPLTEGRTGVLIFVSMEERRAVILGDQAISARLQPEAWVEIIDDLLANFKSGKMRTGFTNAISKVGVILAREFPIQPEDRNELPNGLVVKD